MYTINFYSDKNRGEAPCTVQFNAVAEGIDYDLQDTTDELILLYQDDIVGISFQGRIG